MKVRTTPAGTTVKTTTAVGAATLTVCVAAAVTACTNSPSSTRPAIFTPSVSASASGPGSGAGGGSSSGGTRPGAGSSASARPSGAPSSAGSGGQGSGRQGAGGHSPAPSASFTYAPPKRSHSGSFPTAAPQTGGGGTAGLQDGLLFGVGGAAVLAGAGSLALRRKVRRKLRSPAGDDAAGAGDNPRERPKADVPDIRQRR